MKPRGPNVNTTATEPSGVQARRILDLKNEDKGESPLMANTRYTKTKERPAGIQQSTNAEMIRARYSEELLSNQRCGVMTNIVT